MIYIYNLEISNPSFSVNEANLLSILSNKRQQKVLSYYFEIDRLLSLYSALVVRMCLSKITGIPYNKLDFSYTDLGKPYLNNSNIFFNLSHTKNGILLAVSTDSDIGADIENVQIIPPYNIINDIFHPAEIEFIHKTPTSLQTRFYEIWTKKEAYLKYLGTGLTSNMKDFNSLNLSGYIYTYNFNSYVNSVYCKNSSPISKYTILQEDIFQYYSVI